MLIGSLTQNGAVIGGAVMLVLAVVFFLVRGAVRSHLIANRASLPRPTARPGRCSSSCWWRRSPLVFGLLGGFWAALSFGLPMGVLCLVTLALFIMLFIAARGVRR